jgi:hypothetical protein
MRETKIITLPVTGLEVEVNAFVTGHEKRQITQVLLQNGSLDLKSQEIKGDIPLDLIYKANDKAVEILVKRIGDKANIKEAIEALPVKDYDFLYAEIDKITKDADFLAQSQK